MDYIEDMESREQLKIRLTPQVIATLDELARNDGRSRNNYIEQVL